MAPVCRSRGRHRSVLTAYTGRDAPGPETRGIVIPSDMPPQKRTLMPMSGGS